MGSLTRLSWPDLTWHRLAKPIRLHTNPLSKYTETVAFTGCWRADPHPVSLNPNESTTSQWQPARCLGGAASFQCLHPCVCLCVCYGTGRKTETHPRQAQYPSTGHRFTIYSHTSRRNLEHPATLLVPFHKSLCQWKCCHKTIFIFLYQLYSLILQTSDLWMNVT